MEKETASDYLLATFILTIQIIMYIIDVIFDSETTQAGFCESNPVMKGAHFGVASKLVK